MKRSHLSYRYQRALLNRIARNWRTPKAMVIAFGYMLRGDAKLLRAAILRGFAARLNQFRSHFPQSEVGEPKSIPAFKGGAA